MAYFNKYLDAVQSRDTLGRGVQGGIVQGTCQPRDASSKGVIAKRDYLFGDILEGDTLSHQLLRACLLE
jgi:hypothetical protein